ncbi:nuclear factor of activated T-cells 5 isoform X2 [Chrysoperla carnea]|uniref:nuclear factor of activated T-cells 5 isoform X2 n=1 Tax=Chrysoperla carnea TaxID=189513 RepID=UPI001D0839EB|nr:nuclear factor of activated T-cells 5 isoform X2 [Chrysoperla carnea]
MKMTMSTASTLAPRVHRKVLRVATKRLNNNNHHNRNFSIGKGRASMIRGNGGGAINSVDPCENSNDSGLGFDHHMDYPLVPRNKYQRGEYPNNWSNNNNERNESKKCKMEIKMESDDSNDNYSFPENTTNCKETTSLIRTAPASMIPSLGRTANHNPTQTRAVPRCLPLTNRRSPTGPITLTTQLGNISRNNKVQLQIICQPEQQHRARYQTEGSRGAVKDRTGNGFPIVKLIGYDKPATLQVFIGTDMGRVAPHMFYQACRVSGKNSTPCVEKKIEGTIVIEVELDPTKEMMVTCDCVGILKERNVDVEHRFPDQSGPRSKKKSTRCRMVFRTTITHDDGSTETLQTSSQPIVCTQPPGVPEICKKSLSMCPTTGNVELFILGKNFLKDTRVIFQQTKHEVNGDRDLLWEETVTPDKEYLQQTHLVCIVPPYIRHNITDPVAVSLFVVSSGKTSEPHQFMYTPSSPPSTSATVTSPAFMAARDEIRPVMLWQTMSDITPKAEMDVGMMPPPTSLMPLSQRRPSTNMNMIVPDSLKTEMMDDNSSNSDITVARYNENSMDVHPSDSNMGSMSDNSMDGSTMMQRTSMLATSSMSVLHSEPETITLKKENMDRRGSINLTGPTENMVLGMALQNENSMDVSIPPLPVSLEKNLENSLRPPHVVHDANSINAIRCTEPNPTLPIAVNEGNIGAMRLSETSVAMPNLRSDPSDVMIARDELKGIDLRMKGPIVTVADLINTQSPSLATLRHFGVSEANAGPLPAQSGQSVENYLTTIESGQTKLINNQTTILSNDMNNQKMLLTDSTKLDITSATIFNSQASVNNPLFAQTNTSTQSTMNPLNGLMPPPVITGDQSNIMENGTATKALFTEAAELTTTQSITNDILVSTNLSNSNISHTNIPPPIESHLNTIPFSQPSTELSLPTVAPPTLIPNNSLIYTPQTKSDTTLAMISQSTNNELTVITNHLLSQVQAQQTTLAVAQSAVRLDALVATAMETNILKPTAATVKLDALVNSTVETHMGSPPSMSMSTSSEPAATYLSSPPASQNIASPQNQTSSSPIICPQSTVSTHPLSPTAVSKREIINTPSLKPPDLILNSNLMCPNNTTQENLMLNNICQATSPCQPCQIIPPTQEPVLSPTRKVPPVAIKNLILSATNIMDSESQLRAQQTIQSILQEQSLENAAVQATSTATSTIIDQQLNTMFPTDGANNSGVDTPPLLTNEPNTTNTATHFITQSSFNTTHNTSSQNVVTTENSPVIPVPVKEMVNSDTTVPSINTTNTGNTTVGKERLITQEITSMSDTDLLSYINTSCFDQV